jgi:hypothetical protein
MNMVLKTLALSAWFVILLGVDARSDDACFVSRGKSTGSQPVEWSAHFILTDQYNLIYRINACTCGGPGSSSPYTILYIDNFVEVKKLTGLGGAPLPLKGSIALTQPQIQALMEGRMYLFFWPGTCFSGLTNGYLLPTSCVEP